MRKIILLISFLASFASADYLMNTTYYCLKSFYFVPSTGTLYYTRSDTGITASLTTKSLADDIIDGYEYNATSNQCYKTPFNNTLKIENNDFSYMMGLTGLICGLLVAISALMLLKRGTE